MTKAAIVAALAALEILLSQNSEQLKLLSDPKALILDQSCIDCEVKVSTEEELREAVANAPPGDRIIVTADITLGTTLKIGRELTLQGSTTMPAGRVPGTLPTTDAEKFTPTVPMPILRGRLEIAAEATVTGLQFRPGGDTLITIVKGTSNVTLDRVVLDGEDSGIVRRGIAGNGANVTLKDSVVVGIYKSAQDSQGFCAWDGPGPFTITGNAIEGASENIMFGGADPSTKGLIMSDILIEDNFIYKRPSWKPRAVSVNVKNLLELKNAQRVKVLRNTFRGSWTGGQSGAAIVTSVRNQGGACTWCVVKDVLFQYNHISDAGGMSGIAQDNVHPSARGSDVTVRDNFFETVGRVLHLGQGWLRYTFDHNTVINPAADRIALVFRGSVRMPDGTTTKAPPHEAFTFTNNVTTNGTTYGFWSEEGGAHCGGCGGPLIPSPVFTGNVIGGAPAIHKYPAGNHLNTLAVFWANLTGSPDYRLITPDPYPGVSTDGTPVGRRPEPAGRSPQR